MMENVDDITNEMRYVARLYLLEGVECRAQFEMLDSYADRLDKAYKREIKSIIDANEIAMRTAMGEVAKRQKENAELIRACNLWFGRAEELRKRCDEFYNEGDAK